jgi:hypothetical protein
LGELAHQGALLVVGELPGQPELDLAPQPGIAAGFHGFDGVPQFPTVEDELRRILRRHDEGFPHHDLPAGVAEPLVGPVFASAFGLEVFSGTVSGAANGAVSLGAGHR